jgi:hypothetical protein
MLLILTKSINLLTSHRIQLKLPVAEAETSPGHPTSVHPLNRTSPDCTRHRRDSQRRSRAVGYHNTMGLDPARTGRCFHQG